METFVDYVTEVLVRDGSDTSQDVKLKIRISREEDVFTLFLGDEEICFGTWGDNLLDMFKRIINTENTIET